MGLFCLVVLSGCVTTREDQSEDWIGQLIQEMEAEQPVPAKKAVEPAEPAPAQAAAVRDEQAPVQAAAVQQDAQDPVPGPKPAPAIPEGVPVGTVVIQPESIVDISVKEDPTLDGRYLVNDFSAIDFSYVGLVILHEMTAEQAAEKIRSVLESRYLRQATVTVKITKASYDRVFVDGEVLKPGMLKIGPGTQISLSDALLRAGGLRPQAVRTQLKVVPGGMLNAFRAAAEGTVYPLVDENGKPTVPGVQLQNNDLVYVYSGEDARPVGDRKIVVLGEVARPGPVHFMSGEPCSLMYLLFKMGGLPRFAKADAIKIVRRDERGAETEIVADAEVLLKYGRPEDDVTLENGDTVIVPYRGFSLF